MGYNVLPAEEKPLKPLSGGLYAFLHRVFGEAFLFCVRLERLRVILEFIILL